MLDVANTLGLSNTVMRLIEKRTSQVSTLNFIFAECEGNCVSTVSGHVHCSEKTVV